MKTTKNRGTPLHPRLISPGFVIASVAAVFGSAAMMYVAVTAVRTGRGIETYRTVWLVEDSWIGFLVFVGVTVAAMILAALFRLRDYVQWRTAARVSGDQIQTTDSI